MTDQRRAPDINLDPDRLAAELRKRAMTAAMLADEAGLSDGTVSGILHRGRPCSVRTARAIAAVLVRIEPVPGLDLITRREAA
jgi:lambda repressor-like predicted transcriptional regulator